jgi:hypothetical protein
MSGDIRNSATTSLCYLPAARVTSPAGALSELELLTACGEPFGNVEGVVIDAAARKVKYFAISTSGWLRRRKFVLEAGHLAQIDLERKTLRLRADVDMDQVVDLDPAALREFSDDDLLTVIFAPRAA